MSGSEIRFTCELSKRLNKTGEIKPDDKGYYTMIVGQLNACNIHGAKYALEGARQLFEDRSSAFMRQIAAGNLRGEAGHPKKLPGETDEAFLNRNLSVDERNTCVFFKEVWLDYEYAKKFPQEFSPGTVVIFAKLKPAGAKANILERALANPDENICFSIRCLARQVFEKGKPVRYITEILTFDYVGDPGMATATKFLSPYTEDASIKVTRNMLERMIHSDSPLYTESNKAVAHRVLAQVIQTESKRPAHLNW